MYNNSFKTRLKRVSFLILLISSQIYGFGKNKVQYAPLSWSYISSQHFNVYFHQDLNNLPGISNNWIEYSYKSLSERFQFSHKKLLPLIIYGNPTLFAQTNIITEILPDEVGGFTEFFKTRIVIPFNGSYNELHHVLHHELVHAFIFGIIFDQFGGSMFNNIQIPLWFNEGLAEFLSSGWNIESDMFLMEQTLNSIVPVPGPELDGYMAYKGGQSFFFFLQSSRGDSTFTNFLREFKKSRNVSSSILKIYHKPLEDLGKEWQKELRRIYWPEIGKREEPLKKATAVTSHLLNRDHFNLRPKISPDGDKIAFFSDRRDFTRILITNRKGTILQEISQNGYGGYFESFHPFRSGVCWSPDGSSLAFITQNKGKDEIRLVDIQKKKLKKRIVPQVQNISSPNWSYDSNYLTFCGIANGFNDIFLYNLQNDSLSRITHSIQFEEDPHFSPDGKNILFSILDTCGTGKNQFSAYGATASELATIDIKNGTVKYLTHTKWNEKQPAYSKDGKKIIFVSDRNGLDNLYIAPVDTPDHTHALTDYIGGCSYPDWSGDGSVAFSLFQNQGWDIYLIENAANKLHTDTLAVTNWVQSESDTSRHFFSPADLKSDSLVELTEGHHGRHLKKKSKPTVSDHSPAGKSVNPPKTDSSSLINTIQSDTQPAIMTNRSEIKDSSTVSRVTASIKEGIQNQKTDSSRISMNSGSDTVSINTKTGRPYRLKFTPDLVAFGLGVSNYYSPAGQILLSFSDLLGDHQFTFAGDVQGNIRDYINLYASYIYLRKRVDLGVGGYLSRDYVYESIYGDRLSHETEYGGFFLARYPFSMFSRFDLEVFGCHIERDPLDSNYEVYSQSTILPSLTYTFDNILWGLTGPVNGIRASAKLMVSPPLKFINESFISFDADIRAYFHIAKRFVWANKIFAGASTPLGKGASARRYFLGGDENWLSYDINETEYRKNILYTFYGDFVTPFRGYKYLALTGTRVAVLNSEFRFPFIKELSIAWPLPMEIRYVNGSVFADIGNAWDSETKYKGLLPDNLYAGFGFGLRADLGIFILRYDRGWPTDFHKAVGAPINYFSLGAEF